jgi:tetratricopeptide (TPR) repeat protein/DNA-binding CsgD family transcriptional regulator
LFARESETIDSLKIALSTERNPIQRTEILIALTDVLLSSDPDEALDYGNQALSLAIETNNEIHKLKAWLQIGEIYWSQSDFRTSLDYGNKAKSLAYDMDLDREYAESLILISRNFSDLGDFEKSSDLNFQALKIFEELGDKKGIGKAFNRIGYDYFEQENDDKALTYYLESLRIAREINDLVGISRGLNNVAAVYGNKGEYNNFEANIIEAIEINKKVGRRLWEGINYLNLGSIYRDEQNFDTSLYYYNKAGKIFMELNNLPKLTAIYTSLSMFYDDLGKVDSSLYYAELAYKLGKENNLKKTIYNAAKRLHNIYYYQNDFVNAYRYSMIEHQMKDSLDIETSMTRLSQLELLYEFNKLEQENKIKQQRREYYYIIVGTGLVFLLVLLVIIIINRNRLKRKNQEIEKRKLESELEIRNKELASNVMTLMRKNEILSEIADKLMDIRSEAVRDETKSAIKRIARELQKTTDNEIWEEFETRFKQVHGDFYERLNAKYPDLSPNEQKICAFLRLNMSTKEISELTGQRISTLEIARSRLRKKLGITNTKTNLVSFLSQI